MQTKRMSLIETFTSLIVGLVISYAMAYTVLPIWGFEANTGSATSVTFIYTIVSVIRSYVIRRSFNFWYVRSLG